MRKVWNEVTGGGFDYQPGMMLDEDDSGAGAGGGGGDDLDAKIRAAVEEQTRGLKANRDEFKADRDRARERADKLEKEVKTLKEAMSATGQTDLNAIAEGMKKLNDEKEKQLFQSGDVEGLRNHWLSVHETNAKSQQDALANQLAEAQAQLEGERTKNRRHRIGGALQSEATKAGVDPKAIDLAVNLGLDQFGFDKEGNITALNPDGSTRFTPDGKEPYKPKHFIQELRTERAFMFKGSSGGGAQGNNDPRGGNATQYTLEQWQSKLGKADASERKALIADKRAGKITVEG